MKLQGRSAIVTGASSGLGYAIAAAFIAEGANVAICARNQAALAQAEDCLVRQAGAPERVLAARADVSRRDDVEELVRRSIEQFGALEILVNNAGVLGPMGKTEEVDIGEWSRTIETNLHGVLLPCQALIPHLRKRNYGKILNLSGGGATSPRPFFSAYAASKAAVIRLTENLAVELAGSGIDVNAVAPGALNTRMLNQVLEAGEGRIGSSQFAQAIRQQQMGGSSVETAVALCVHLASAAADGLTGRLISAPWDPWSSIHEHLDELRASDIYTLRRIVPSDRGKAWS